MNNRKFDIKRDFHALVELEHEIIPLLRKLENSEEREKVEAYVRKTFNNQWKTT